MDGCKGIQNEMPKGGFEKNSPRVNFFKQCMWSIALLHLRDDNNWVNYSCFLKMDLLQKYLASIVDIPRFHIPSARTREIMHSLTYSFSLVLF